jgi:gluconolactonase
MDSQSRHGLEDGLAKLAVMRAPCAGCGGLDLMRAGTLALAEAGQHRVVEVGADGRVQELADACADGTAFDAPNDLVVSSMGIVYVTEPFVRRVIGIWPDGAAHVLWQGEAGTKPNGIELSPDERTLYVTDTLQNGIRRFVIHADGRLGAPTILASGLGLDVPGEWVTDGMAVDRAGNLYVASYIRPDSLSEGEIAVIAPDGHRWGRIRVPRGPSNVAFGGVDEKTLFITAQDTLYRVPMPIAGRPRAGHRASHASVSTWSVWGNMSNKVSARRRRPPAIKTVKSFANEAG